LLYTTEEGEVQKLVQLSDYGFPRQEIKKAPTRLEPTGAQNKKELSMTNTADDCDYDFNESDSMERDQGQVVCLLLALKTFLDDKKVNSRGELARCTDMFLALERLKILQSSDAYQEILRLRRVWKYRLEAQADIDRWMHRYQPGTPLY
jgi:hypothetical protein